MLAALRDGQLRAFVHAAPRAGREADGRLDALWPAAREAVRAGSAAEGAEIVRVLLSTECVRIGALRCVCTLLGEGLLRGAALAAATHECQVVLASLAAELTHGGDPGEDDARAAALINVACDAADGVLGTLALTDEQCASQASDALDVLVGAAHAAYAVGHAVGDVERARTAAEAVVSALLQRPWPPPALPAIFAALPDLPLSEAQAREMRLRARGAWRSARTGAELVSCAAQLVVLAEQPGQAGEEWAHLLRLVARDAPPDASADLFAVVALAVSHNAALQSTLDAQLAAWAAGPGGAADEEIALQALLSDALFFLALAHADGHSNMDRASPADAPSAVLRALVRASRAPSDAGHGGGSPPHNVWAHLVRHPAAELLAGALCELALHAVSAAAVGCKAPGDHHPSVGDACLLAEAVVGALPAVRTALFRALLAGVLDAPTAHGARQAHGAVLCTILTNQPDAVFSHAREVASDTIARLALIQPPSLAAHIAAALARVALAPPDGSLCREFTTAMHKLATGRNPVATAAAAPAASEGALLDLPGGAGSCLPASALAATPGCLVAVHGLVCLLELTAFGPLHGAPGPTELLRPIVGDAGPSSSSQPPLGRPGGLPPHAPEAAHAAVATILRVLHCSSGANRCAVYTLLRPLLTRAHRAEELRGMPGEIGDVLRSLRGALHDKLDSQLLYVPGGPFFSTAGCVENIGDAADDLDRACVAEPLPSLLMLVIESEGCELAGSSGAAGPAPDGGRKLSAARGLEQAGGQLSCRRWLDALHASVASLLAPSDEDVRSALRVLVGVRGDERPELTSAETRAHAAMWASMIAISAAGKSAAGDASRARAVLAARTNVLRIAPSISAADASLDTGGSTAFASPEEPHAGNVLGVVRACQLFSSVALHARHARAHGGVVEALMDGAMHTPPDTTNNHSGGGSGELLGCESNELADHALSSSLSLVAGAAAGASNHELALEDAAVLRLASSCAWLCVLRGRAEPDASADTDDSDHADGSLGVVTAALQTIAAFGTAAARGGLLAQLAQGCVWSSMPGARSLHMLLTERTGDANAASCGCRVHSRALVDMCASTFRRDSPAARLPGAAFQELVQSVGSALEAWLALASEQEHRALLELLVRAILDAVAQPSPPRARAAAMPHGTPTQSKARSTLIRRVLGFLAPQARASVAAELVSSLLGAGRVPPPAATGRARARRSANVAAGLSSPATTPPFVHLRGAALLSVLQVALSVLASSTSRDSSSAATWTPHCSALRSMASAFPENENADETPPVPPAIAAATVRLVRTCMREAQRACAVFARQAQSARTQAGALRAFVELIGTLADDQVWRMMATAFNPAPDDSGASRKGASRGLAHAYLAERLQQGLANVLRARKGTASSADERALMHSLQRALDQLVGNNRAWGARCGSASVATLEKLSAPDEVQPRSAQRKRPRSSNPYIDSALRKEPAGDTYADLEGFIVCKPGRRYG